MGKPSGEAAPLDFRYRMRPIATDARPKRKRRRRAPRRPKKRRKSG